MVNLSFGFLFTYFVDTDCLAHSATLNFPFHTIQNIPTSADGKVWHFIISDLSFGAETVAGNCYSKGSQGIQNFGQVKLRIDNL